PSTICLKPSNRSSRIGRPIATNATTLNCTPLLAECCVLIMTVRKTIQNHSTHKYLAPSLNSGLPAFIVVLISARVGLTCSCPSPLRHRRSHKRVNGSDWSPGMPLPETKRRPRRQELCCHSFPQSSRRSSCRSV